MSELNEILSEREREILCLVATGAPNKEIARQLVISPNTVKVHLRNIFTKIGVSTRTEATLYAVQMGLVNPSAETEMAQEEAVEEPASTPGDAGFHAVPTASRPADGTLSAGAHIYDAPAARTPPVASGPARTAVRPTLIFAGLILLLAAVLFTTRLFNPNRVSPAAAQQTTQAGETPIRRWAMRTDLPEPRKGMGVAEYENQIYVIGGETSAGIDSAVLRYSPESAAWEKLKEKDTPVTEVQAALLGEKIYVPGGRKPNGAGSSVLEIYDPRENRWETGKPLPLAIYGYALAAFEGRLYLFGGMSGDQVLDSVYVYNPEEKSWSKHSPMDTPRAYAQAVVQNGRIYVIGGFDGRRALDLNQAFLPNRDAAGEDAWETYAPLPEGRYAMGSASLASAIYLAGGLTSSGRPAQAPLQYTVPTDQWVTFDAPPERVGGLPAMQSSGNFLFVIGGELPESISKKSLSYQAIYTIAVPILRSSGGGDAGNSTPESTAAPAP